MNNQATRRFFLRNILMASIGFSILSVMSTKATTKAKINSSALNANLQPGELNGREIIVEGKIYDKTGKLTRNDATIEVWQLSSLTKKYEFEKNIVPNKAGEYQYVTDVPVKELDNAKYTF